MKIFSIAFTIIIAFFAKSIDAQVLSLQVPVKQEVRIGEEVRISLNVQGLTNYSIKMENNPPSAILEGNRFTWTPKINEESYYMVSFHLMDTTTKEVDQVQLELLVKPSDLKPFLTFDHPLADTINLIENQSFHVNATIKSQQNTDPRLLLTYFTFNEDPELRTFDSCKVSINGDRLSFHWTPSNKEAMLEYIKFRITIIDLDGCIFSKVLNFKIQNINQEPYFRNEIADTIYLPSHGLSINYTAIDPDNDKLKYDYFPKNPAYLLEGTSIVFKSDYLNSPNENLIFPIFLTLKVSDNKTTIQKRITVLKDKIATTNNSSFLQPTIGDFTKKIFSEGDSLVTYLNISNYKDLKQLEIIYSDLTLPPGIKSITKQLVFEKKDSYIKVYSKGVLPYSLVDKDYNYNISVLVSDKNTNRPPSFKVLVLTIEDKPDPKNIVQEKDSLIQFIHNYLRTENAYQATLEKVRSRINRPWWKKAAIISGMASGVLTLIQSERSDKTISAISASVSLISIMVSNLPGLSEKTLAVMDEKIANSKSRTERIQEKESEFYFNWSMDEDRSNFYQLKAEIADLINKSTLKRNDDVCALKSNKKINAKLTTVIKSNLNKDNNSKSLEEIFKCSYK